MIVIGIKDIFSTLYFFMYLAIIPLLFLKQNIILYLFEQTSKKIGFGQSLFLRKNNLE